MSINGQRLTGQTAIRAAGEAILVDLRPLSPPYLVRAVGNPDAMEPAFADSPTARRFSTWTSLYGIKFVAARAGRLDPAGCLDRRNPGAVPVPTPSTGGAVIPALALAVGVLLGLVVHPTVPAALQPYLPIAVVAALDAVFGAVRAQLDGIFDDRVFVVSFVSNVLVAALVVFLGDQLGVGAQLSTGVVVVLGIRIFTNAAAIRRHLFHA